jgi:hypothetical protein
LAYREIKRTGRLTFFEFMSIMSIIQNEQASIASTATTTGTGTATATTAGAATTTGAATATETATETTKTGASNGL